eukprot:6145394-Pyramimonas_sp.AAC.1
MAFLALANGAAAAAAGAHNDDGYLFVEVRPGPLDRPPQPYRMVRHQGRMVSNAGYFRFEDSVDIPGVLFAPIPSNWQRGGGLL